MSYKINGLKIGFWNVNAIRQQKLYGPRYIYTGSATIITTHFDLNFATNNLYLFVTFFLTHDL